MARRSVRAPAAPLASAARGQASAEATRRALVDAALTVFAAKGYEAGSVRDITARAKANQGAITYHFGGKEGLYREVLREARRFMSAQPLLDVESVESLPLEEALRLFLRQALAPLAETARIRRYLRIFAWEQLDPTPVSLALRESEPFAILLLARRIVERFVPEAEPQRAGVLTAWLLGQTYTFIRDMDWLGRPPFGLVLDRTTLDGLIEDLWRLAFNALSRFGPGSTKA